MIAKAQTLFLGRILTLSVSAIALSTAAQAQEQASPTQDGSSESGAPTGGIQDIVVTAQRRAENIQRSSLAIQAVSADTLSNAGVSQAQDLTTVVPGLQVSQYGPIVQTYIRGVGDGGANAINVSPIAYNIDGVYISRGESIGTNFYDLERVEVLKGPQGTLYGRNASGGAVNIITRRPNLTQVEGYATGELGNLDYRHLEAAINLPLGDTLAIRGAFNLVRRDGYLSDGTSDDRQTAGRIRALWEPADGISLLVNFDAAHVGGKGGGFTYLPRRPGAGDREGTLDPAAQAYLLTRNPVLVTSTTPFLDGDFQNVSAELNADLGFATLTVIPAYRHVKYEAFGHSGFVVGQASDTDQTSLELRLSNANDQLKWVAGLYYFREKGDAKATIIASPFIQDTEIFFAPRTKSYAAFGEATYSITDRFRAIAGLRYTSDDRGLGGRVEDNIFGTTQPFVGQKTFRKVTWKAGAEFDVAPQNMLFATASTGFKSGGINQEVAPNVYNPEVLTAFELGSRNRFLDNKLQVNVELFYWKYKGKQETTITLDNTFFVNLLTLNAGKATIKGANIDVMVKPTDNDTIQLAAEYNDARYDSFVSQTINSAFGVQFFDPRSTGCAVGAPTPGPLGSTQRTIDCSGFRLPRAPKWTGSVSYEHVFALNGGAELKFGADAQLATGRYLATSFTSSSKAPGYALFNGNVSFTPASKKWTLTAFMRNITNEALYQGGFPNSYAANFFAATINPPRTYGGRLTYNF